MPNDASPFAAAPSSVNDKPRPFRITTVVGVGLGQDESDPLLVAQINGTEAVSAPYSFDLTLLQRKTNLDGTPRPRIEASDLLNTPATFGVSMQFNHGQFFQWFDRHGTIDRFEEVAESPSKCLRCYVVRVVPSLRLLERERTFRIFENLDVITIIRAVFRAQGDIPSDYLILNLNGAEFPPMPYCVQFGEDSLAFVTRLMATYGLWYFFKHGLDRDSERMVLGKGRLRPSGDTAVLHSAGAPQERQIAGYRRIYSPTSKRMTVGDFNPIKPEFPFRGSETINPSYDIATKNNIHLPGRFQQRIFPGNALGGTDLAADARSRIESGEALVFTGVGQSKNPTLRAGEGVVVFTSNEPQAVGEKMVLTTLSIHGIDANLGRSVDNFGQFAKVLFNGLNPFGDGKISDISATIAQNEIGNFLLNATSSALKVAGGVGSAMSGVNSVAGVVNSAVSSIDLRLPNKVVSVAAAVTSVNDGTKDFLKGPKIDYGNSFVGVSQADVKDDSFLLPPPTGQKPIAHGPHPAVVIGPDGTQTFGGNDLYADALGRVRVRFPWHPPDESGDPLAEPPFASGKDSAWLRVSEGWAGRGWGTQFLPRIGQEVLVGFIDGDPERPIVTGRLYNADSGTTNLPFPGTGGDRPTVGKLSDLPATVTQHLPQSGIVTQATPRPDGDAQRFHMLRFDDSWKQEQLLVRSQRRLDVRAFASAYHTTGGNHNLLVGWKDDGSGKQGGDLDVTVGNDYQLHVNGGTYARVEKILNLTVVGEAVADLQANLAVLVAGKVDLNASKIVLEAKEKISLKVGSSFIVIDPAGVTIVGAQVKINSGGAGLTTGDPSIEDPADAAPADTGEPGWIGRHSGGGRGGRKKRQLKSQHGPPPPPPTHVPGSPASAPGTIQLQPNVNKAMQDAFGRSFPGGKSQEHGGTLVQDKDGNVTVVNEHAGTTGTLTQDRNVGPGQTIVGTYHTHPYDASEGGHKGVSFSDGDMANAAENNQPSLVDAGDKQFMVVPTAQTPPVDRDQTKKDWQAAFDQSRASGKTFPEATRDAAASVAKKNNMAYYEGQDGTLRRVE